MTMNTARALDKWVRETAIPAVGTRGGGLVELTVAAHYACRNRNNRRDARLSEHAKGNAIDISSVVMQDGSRVTVLRGWGNGADGRLLKKLWRGACGPFGTVLGVFTIIVLIRPSVKALFDPASGLAAEG